jgi:hypothetical protein
MSMSEEPGSIIIARRALSERQNQVMIGQAWSNLLPQYQQDVEEISAFLADWEAGNVSE